MLIVENSLLIALEQLIEYCHYSEGWQDEHADILKNAEVELAKALGVKFTPFHPRSEETL